MTIEDLLKLLEPYGPKDQVVFVTFEKGIIVHEEIEVAKGHTSTCRVSDGLSMPVAIYLVDEGHRGKGGVQGGDPGDIASKRRPKPTDEPKRPDGED